MNSEQNTYYGPHFKINTATKEIILVSGSTILAKNDHKSKKVTFEVPKIVEGYDISACNSVRVNYLNIDAETKKTYEGFYEVQDFGISEENENIVTGTWEIRRSATKAAGTLSFTIHFFVVGESGEIHYAWNTGFYHKISVVNNIEDPEADDNKYFDIFQQWKAEIEERLKDVVIDSKVSHSLLLDRDQPGQHSIGAVSGLAAQLEDLKVFNNASGEPVVLDDSSDDYLRGLKIYGRTTQDKIPGVDNPAVFYSAGENGSIETATTNMNLLPLPYSNLSGFTTAGIKFTINDDGAVVANGIATANTTFALINENSKRVVLPAGKYFVSGSPKGGSNSSYSVVVRTSDRSVIAQDVGDGKLFEIKNASPIHATVYIASGTVCENLTFYPVLNVGTEKIPWQAGRRQAASFSIPDKLNGVPVSTGGNYTDKNGQRWISDEMNSDAVFVKRIKEIIVDGTKNKFVSKSGSTDSYIYSVLAPDIDLNNYDESGLNPILCSHGQSIPHGSAYSGVVGATAYKSTANKYLRFSFGLDEKFDTLDKANAWLISQSNAGTPLTFIYASSEYEQVHLSSDEFTALHRQLHTYTDGTIVLTDSDAGITVTYVQKTAKYLSEKLLNDTEEIPELFSIFKRIGVIGDSMAAGECKWTAPDGTSRSVDFIEHSWPQYLGRMLGEGHTVYNFTRGGLSTDTWLTHPNYGWPVASDGKHPADCYIIALGINDGWFKRKPIGTQADVDLDNPENSGDTMYGNYYRIITRLKSLEPYAKFFLMNQPYNMYGLEEYQAIEGCITWMAENVKNCYLVDMKPYANRYASEYLGFGRGKHSCAAGYKWAANIIHEALNKVIYANPKEFAFVELINTEYESEIPEVVDGGTNDNPTEE